MSAETLFYYFPIYPLHNSQYVYPLKKAIFVSEKRNIKILLMKLKHLISFFCTQVFFTFISLYLCEILGIKPISKYNYSFSAIDFFKEFFEILKISLLLFFPIFLGNVLIFVYKKRILSLFKMEDSLFTFLFFIFLNIIFFLIFYNVLFSFVFFDYIKIIPGLLLSNVIIYSKYD